MKLLECKRLVGSIFAFLIGVLYLITIGWGYYPAFTAGEYIHLGEWCFITGAVGGLFYLFSALRGGVGRRGTPAILCLNVSLVLQFILIATVTMGLNVDGAYWFIHIINPVLVLVHFFLFCDCREVARPKLLLTCNLFPILYLVLAFCLQMVTGTAPFPAGLIFQQGNVPLSLGIILILCGLVTVLAVILFRLNKWLHTRFTDRAHG